MKVNGIEFSIKVNGVSAVVENPHHHSDRKMDGFEMSYKLDSLEVTPEELITMVDKTISAIVEANKDNDKDKMVEEEINRLNDKVKSCERNENELAEAVAANENAIRKIRPYKDENGNIYR